MRFLDALCSNTLRRADPFCAVSIGGCSASSTNILDDPYIPYYNPKQNRVARFIPDFIFWGRKGNAYTILFVDPKGMEQIDWERKVDGYKRLFEDEHGDVKCIMHENVDVTVRLALFTRDRNHCPEGEYKRYWHDNIQSVFAPSTRLVQQHLADELGEAVLNSHICAARRSGRFAHR